MESYRRIEKNVCTVCTHVTYLVCENTFKVHIYIVTVKIRNQLFLEFTCPNYIHVDSSYDYRFRVFTVAHIHTYIPVLFQVVFLLQPRYSIRLCAYKHMYIRTYYTYLIKVRWSSTSKVRT